MRRLPSLNGLRAFEAAARHGSFAGAAGELNVSQAAVSRLVRLLELRLRFPLFERRANGLDLTPQGRAFHPGLTDAFDAIGRLTEQVTAMAVGPVLTVGVGATFAIRWLIPRLGGFTRAHPGIEVRIATGGAFNPIHDEWTCSIRLGDGDWPGFVAVPLFSAELVAVCTGAIAVSLREPGDLARATLLQVSHSPEDWPNWLAAAGLADQIKARGPRFDNYAMALQAALDGAGVALGLKSYLTEDLAAGRLVTPFALTVPKGRAWYLAYRPARRDDPTLQLFQNWLENAARGLDRPPQIAATAE